MPNGEIHRRFAEHIEKNDVLLEMLSINETKEKLNVSWTGIFLGFPFHQTRWYETDVVLLDYSHLHIHFV